MSSATDTNTAPGWEVRNKPPLLSRRFEFDGYPATRAFLDALESLSKETGYYPDLGFATKHVNVTVAARDGSALTAVDYEFAARVTALADRPA